MIHCLNKEKLSETDPLYASWTHHTYGESLGKDIQRVPQSKVTSPIWHQEEE